MKNLRIFSAILAFSVLLGSCDNESVESSGNASEAKKAELPEIEFYALAGGTSLDMYSTSAPETIMGSVEITGLQPDEKILAIDFRPATGQLYGLGSTSRLYVINPDTGMARMIGTGPFTPTLSGSIAGFDFNPTVDRIRVVTDSGQNLRINPETGAVAVVDGEINGATGAMIAAVAYTGNFSGSASTTLYDIDLASRKLYKQIPPNNGTLVEVGELKLKIEGEGGFDISDQNDAALGLFEVNNKSTLFSVNLMTGRATIIAKYSKELMYTGIAIATRPVAYAVTSDNMLKIFNPETPSMTINKTITGLMAGETLLGIDFRPVNGQLFGLGSTSRLYTINVSSGAAMAVASLSIPLDGTSFGFDFNPLVDRIRIVSNTGQNLRVNPMDGAAIMDGMLNPGMPMVTAAAYANNFAGTTSTMLFDIDVQTDKLYLQTPPNAGTLQEVGSLGVNVESSNGFDIGGRSNMAYALLTSSGTTMLYGINTSTGMATSKGTFSGMVNGFAIGLGF